MPVRKSGGCMTKQSHSSTPLGSIKCPECGKKIELEKSMLGGKRTAWHKPPKGSKAATFAGGNCLGSGTVLVSIDVSDIFGRAG